MSEQFDILKNLNLEIMEAINEGKNFLHKFIARLDQKTQLKLISHTGNTRVTEALFRETEYDRVRIEILNCRTCFELLRRLEKFPPIGISNHVRSLLDQLLNDALPK